jgi:hypothetical protein
MSKGSLLSVMIIAAAFAGNAEAVYKCTTSKGVVYQDHPCIVGTETDLQLVVPTGQVAPTALSSDGEASQVNGTGAEARSGAARANRASANNVAAAGKSGATDKGTGTASRASAARGAGYPSSASSASSASGNSDSQGSSNYPVDAAMAEQLQNTQPSARYFTVDSAAPGMEMPESMNCESPNGDKRRFFFANGKLSSI